MTVVLGSGSGGAYPETVTLSPTSLAPTSSLRLRPATTDDAELLAEWESEPHVIECSTDDPGAGIAFGGMDWRQEVADQSEVNFYRITEVNDRPIGALQIIAPLASNADADRFYQRLGFRAVGRRMFDTDDCLVHRLERTPWEGRKSG